jgi:hypothetical protein
MAKTRIVFIVTSQAEGLADENIIAEEIAGV